MNSYVLCQIKPRFKMLLCSDDEQALIEEMAELVKLHPVLPQTHTFSIHSVPRLITESTK